MEKAKKIITIAGIFLLLFSYGNMSGNINLRAGSNSGQIGSESVQQQTKSTEASSKSAQTKTTSAQTQTKSTQTQAKPAQTQTKSTQTQKKPAQTQSKSAQTKTKSTTTVTKSVQTKKKSTQTGTKSVQTKTKSAPAGSKPATAIKKPDPGTIRIGAQTWTSVNLNVSTFRNGDSIPEARTNKEWVAAGESGKPAWCYYNNDPKNGLKYGKLYNWFAVNDPRGLAPTGWSLPDDADWAKMTYYLGGIDVAGEKMKSTSAWINDNNGTNETGFTGLPGGYRVENGTFLNLGSIGTWWSMTESRSLTAIDYYLVLSAGIGRSNSPRGRGESVRCIRK